MSTDSAPEEIRYKIGVAARLSGLTTHNLRKWETRYGIVVPERTPAGDRVYSPADVRKLTRARALVDAGMEVGEVARLSDEQIAHATEELISAASRRAGRRAGARPRVLPVGPLLADALKSRSSFTALELLPGVSMAEAQAVEPPIRPDLVFVEETNLGRHSKERVDGILAKTGAAAAVVLYTFGPSWGVGALRSPRVSVVHMPVEAEELQRLALGLWYEMTSPPALGGGPEGGPRPRRFSDDTLLEVSQRLPSVACECPHHLADLLMAIGAFERYSNQCEVEQPEDAALHRSLASTAASARVLFEEALEEVARLEGFVIEEVGPQRE